MARYRVVAPFVFLQPVGHLAPRRCRKNEIVEFNGTPPSEGALEPLDGAARAAVAARPAIRAPNGLQAATPDGATKTTRTRPDVEPLGYADDKAEAVAGFAKHKKEQAA